MKPIIDPKAKRLIMELFPNERTFEMLVQVAHRPGKSLQFYANAHHFDDDSKISDSAKYLEKKGFIEIKEGKYSLTDYAKNVYGEFLDKKLYPECHKCTSMGILTMRDMPMADCHNPKHDFLIESEIQDTGCTDFNEIFKKK